jgi:DNA modification methylase
MPKARLKPMTPATSPTAQIAIEHVAPSSLVPAPYNPRTMGADERKRLERGIREFGLVDPIIARRSDSLVIGGHQRLASAINLGLATVPVVYLEDIDDDRAAALNVLLNNPSAQGEWDLPKLTDLLSELDATGFDATLSGFDDDELRKLLAPTGGLLTDPDDVPPLPAEPITRLGDLITLGRHRLVCGDSTQPETVDKALGGARPALMVTDPPYGVDYEPNWRNEADRANGKPYGAVAVGLVTNDDRSDWRAAFALFPGDVVYCWHAGRHASTVQHSLEECGFEIRSQIIWAKSRLIISRGHYHWQHEPCWYAFRKGESAAWIGDRSQTTLWEIEHQKSETGHSAQKPVEAMRRPLQNHAGDVYDPFLGSGTTLIAAEMMGRACYGIELDPAYCDVICARWENATGQKVVRP